MKAPRFWIVLLAIGLTAYKIIQRLTVAVIDLKSWGPIFIGPQLFLFVTFAGCVIFLPQPLVCGTLQSCSL